MLNQQRQGLREQTDGGAAGAVGAGSGGSSSAGYSITEQQGVWDVDRFLSLLLGEIPRLRDDPAGYGPAGKGFIDHVNIPTAVEAAHARLARRYPQLLRL